MNPLLVAMVVVAVELGVLAVSMLAYLILRHGRRDKRDRAAAADSVARLRSAAPERRERRLSLLARVSGQPVESFQPKMEQLVGRENALYGRIHEAFARREGEQLQGLDADVDALLEEYAVVLAEARPAAAGKAGSGDAAAMASENAELREELGSMRAELDRVLDEYCAAYAGGGDQGVRDLRERLDHVLGDSGGPRAS